MTIVSNSSSQNNAGHVNPVKKPTATGGKDHVDTPQLSDDAQRNEVSGGKEKEVSEGTPSYQLPSETYEYEEPERPGIFSSHRMFTPPPIESLLSEPQGQSQSQASAAEGGSASEESSAFEVGKSTPAAQSAAGSGMPSYYKMASEGLVGENEDASLAQMYDQYMANEDASLAQMYDQYMANEGEQASAANTKQSAANTKQGAANAKQGAANTKQGAANTKQGAANAKQGAANTKQSAVANVENGSAKPKAKPATAYNTDIGKRSSRRDPFGEDAYRRMSVYPRVDENGERVVDFDEMRKAVLDLNEANYANLYRDMRNSKYGKNPFIKEILGGEPAHTGSGSDNYWVFGSDDKGFYAPKEEVPKDAGVAPGNDDQVDDVLFEHQHRKFKEFQKARRLTMRFFLRPQRMRFEGDKFRRGGKSDKYALVHSDEIQRHINTVQKLYDCSEATVIRLYMYAASLGVDNSGKIVGQSMSEFSFSEEQVRAMTDQIVESQSVYGHPLGVVGGYYYIGNTRCYPCGYIDNFTAQEICRSDSSALYGCTVEDLQQAVKDQWMNNTLPDLVVDSNLEGPVGQAQRQAVFNLLRCAMEIDEKYNYVDYGVHPNDDNKTYKENMDSLFLESLGEDADKRENLNLVHAVRDSQDIAKRARQRAETTNRRRNNQSDVMRTIQNVTSTQRFMGTMNPAIIASGFTEKVKGNLVSNGANRLWHKHVLNKAKNREQAAEVERRFSRTRALDELARTEVAVQSVKLCLMIINIGGADAMTAFVMDRSATKLSNVTEKEVMAWLNKYVRGVKSKAEKSGDKKEVGRASEMLFKLNNLTDTLMTGGGITDAMDSVRFFDMFLTNMMGSYLADPAAGDIIDVEGLLQAMESEGIQNTVFHMAAQHQGRSSLISIDQLNMGRRSPLAAVTEAWFREHALTEFLFVVFIDKYLSFGIKTLELHFPMSSTVNYLVAKGILKVSGASSPGGISSLSPELGKYAAVYVGNTMGIDELNGLSQCVIYDLAQMGSTLSVAGVWFSLHMIFGDDDEPDEVLKGSAIEWGFGNLGKIIPAWWWYDMVGYGLGLGTAMYAAVKTGDSKLGWDILVNSTADAWSGTAVMDTINAISSVVDDGEILYKMATDSEYEAPEDFSTERSESSYLTEGVAKLVKNLTPGFVNGLSRDSVLFGDDLVDTSAYKYYTGETREDGTKVTGSIDDYDEILLRSWAKNNIAFAWLLDVTKPLHRNEYNENTGYQFWDMPAATKADQVSMYWYDKLNITDEVMHSSKKSDVKAREAKAEELLRIIKSFDSPEDALAQGFIIPWNARENLLTYCLGQKYLAEEAYLNKSDSLGYNDSRRLYHKYKKFADEMDNIVDLWVYGGIIPSSINRYEKLVSDTTVSYVWKDSGARANAAEWALFPDRVTKVYSQTGNAPSSILPFTTVQKTGAYNDETPVGWYNERFTDEERILKDVDDEEIKLGREAGQLVGPTITGSQDPLNKDTSAERRIDVSENQPFTTNDRRYRYTGKAVEGDVTEEDMKAAAERYGLSLDDLEKLRDKVYNGSGSGSGSGSKGKYSSRRYGYSSGGSGSSYSPRIYSSSQRLYTTKAQGMDVRSPYKASTTYLRPGFSTKGSREAYKRSDI